MSLSVPKLCHILIGGTRPVETGQITRQQISPTARVHRDPLGEPHHETVRSSRA